MDPLRKLFVDAQLHSNGLPLGTIHSLPTFRLFTAFYDRMSKRLPIPCAIRLST